MSLIVRKVITDRNNIYTLGAMSLHDGMKMHSSLWKKKKGFFAPFGIVYKSGKKMADNKFHPSTHRKWYFLSTRP
jgi:hypothetical protein